MKITKDSALLVIDLQNSDGDDGIPVMEGEHHLRECSEDHPFLPGTSSPRHSNSGGCVGPMGPTSDGNWMARREGSIVWKGRRTWSLTPRQRR